MKEKKVKAPNPNKIGVVKFMGWQSRGASLACITIVMGYLMIFCTDTLGLSAGVVGTLMMVSKVFDGVSDFIACYIVDNTRTKWGKGRPYEFCIIGVWVCTMLLFYTPQGWSTVVKCIWVFVMYTMVFSVFSTLLFSAQTPYMIRAFDDNPQKIAKVGALGGIVIMILAMVVSVSFPVLMGKMATSPQGWRTLITIYALPLMVIGMFRFILVKENPKIDLAAGESKVKVRDIVTCMRKNKYVWLFAGMVGTYTVTTGFGAASYYFTYVVGDIKLMGVITMLGVVTLPVMFVFPALMKKFSASQMIMIGAGIGAVGYLILFLAKANMPMLVAGTILMGIGQFPVAYLQANIIMQLADYNEFIGLPRMDSSVGVVAGALSKVGAGIGSGITGLLLGVAGYAGAAAVQSDGAILAIRALYSIAPMICVLLMGFFAIKMQPLDKKGQEITAALEEKRAKALKAVQNA